MNFILNTKLLNNNNYDNYDDIKKYYDNYLAKVRNMKCNCIEERLDITDEFIFEYMNDTNKILNDNSYQLYSDDNYNKMSILKNSLLTENESMDIILTINFENNITNNFDKYLKFLNKIINDTYINWVKKIKINCSESDYDKYLQLIASVYGLFKSKSIKLVSCNINYNYGFDKLIKNNLLQYIDEVSIINIPRQYDENLKFYLEYTFSDKEIYCLYDETSINRDKKYYYDLISILKLNNLNINPVINYDGKLVNVNFDSVNYTYIKFIMNEINDYTISDSIREFNNINIDCIQFTNNYNEIISIIWDNSATIGKVEIGQKRNEFYKTISNDKFLKISNSYYFNNYDGYQIIVLKQKNSLNSIDINLLNKQLFDKFIINDMTREEMLSSLSDEFNTDIFNLNLNRLIESFSYTVSNAKANLKTIYENSYLESVTEEAIYNNFGIFTTYEKKPTQTFEQYKNIIKKLIKSILHCYNTDNMIDLLDTIVNYDYIYNNGTKNANINLTELYSEATTDYERLVYNNRLEVNLESITNSDPKKLEVYKNDILEVVDIIKPAHVIVDVVISYSCEEDFKEWFKEKNNLSFNESDEFELQYTLQSLDNNYSSLETMFMTFGDNGRNKGSLIFSPDLISELDTENDEYDLYPIGIKNRIIESEFSLIKN